MSIIYADKVILARSEVGFVLNFSTAKIEGVPSEEVAAQIGMSPQYAKAFLAHLYSEIGKYEAEFGEIKMPKVAITQLESVKKPPMGFK